MWAHVRRRRARCQVGQIAGWFADNAGYIDSSPSDATCYLKDIKLKSEEENERKNRQPRVVWGERGSEENDADRAREVGNKIGSTFTKGSSSPYGLELTRRGEEEEEWEYETMGQDDEKAGLLTCRRPQTITPTVERCH